jgi:glycosyltransferase involved in cell wall biosynthesis
MIKTANLVGSISRNAGGLFESVRRLVQSLHEKGMEVSVISTQDEHTVEDIGLWSPVKAVAFKPIGPKQFGFSPGFRQALFGFSPDLVHTHGIWTFPSIATNQFRRKKGIPYVISAHGMLDPWALQNSRWKKAVAYLFYEGNHLREASCLRALCESEARAIRASGFKNPVAIIPNGIDIPEVKSQKSEVRSAPWQGFVEPSRKVLLFLSRIHPKKGLPNLLRAWAALEKSEVRNQKSEWTLAIAGWDQGGHEAELKHLATELGLAWADVRNQKSEISSPTSDLRPPTSVVFLGPQFNELKAACYANCDGFILPSFSEGVPMVVLEAWVNSKPVLMTPECNLPIGFERGAAIRIETNVDSIAQGLQEFLQASEAERRTIGEQGLRLARERFAWPHLAREMKQLYEWMLGGGPKPGCVV